MNSQSFLATAWFGRRVFPVLTPGSARRASARAVLIAALVVVASAAQVARARGDEARGISAAVGADRDRVPNGLSRAEWSSIRAAYEAGLHAVAAVEGGHEARNTGQGWRVGFDGRGFAATPDAGAAGGWTWGLRLISYGREGECAERTVLAPSVVEARGQRIAYRWDEALTEWYQNDQRGLEHGYTVHHRLECGSRDAPLRFTLAVRGGLCPSVEAGGRGVIFVDSSGAAVVTYSGLVVVDADGTDVPAWFEPAGEELRLSVDDRGARYPLMIDPIAQQAYLKASNTGASDNFGRSVAVSEDGNTVVVGALGEESAATGVNGDQADNSAQIAGAAYVFVRSPGGNTWSQQAYLKASNTQAFHVFGISVGISGNTIVVGAVGDNGGSSTSGAAYVFVRATGGTTWTQQAYLKASNAGATDQFGTSVSVSGNTVVVGTSREDSNATGVNGNQADNSATNAGAAYVFVRPTGGTTWSQQAYLKASNTAAGDNFGISVAVSGDTVVVGAEGEDSNATGVNGNQADNSAAGAGAVYVFVRPTGGTTWSQQAYVKASTSDVDDNFGSSVAVSGDTVAIGAYREKSNATGVNGNQADNSASASGAAYVFVRPTGGSTWSQQAYLKASNTGSGDNFGQSVAVSGDMVVVGASSEASNATGVNGNQADNSANASGAAYVFVRPSGGSTWSQQGYLKASNTGVSDSFGFSVGVSGETVVVGVTGEASNATGVNGNQADNSAQGSGAAYVFAMYCAADFNRSGHVNSDDLFAFLDAWFAENGMIGPGLSADINGHGSVNSDDLFDFLDVWFAQNGVCP